MPAHFYKIWQQGGPALGGVMGSQLVGISGVAKAANGANPFAVANEVLCGQLGRGLCLPIPPGFLIKKEEVPHHVSLDFNLSGQQLPPADASKLVTHNPEIACGIVLFDAWILNGDRHARNLAYDSIKNEVQLFDHSHAFLPGNQGVASLPARAGQFLPGGHCLAQHLTLAEPFRDWHSRILQIPEFWISDALSSAALVGLPDADVPTCLEFLLRRRESLLSLLDSNRAAFPRITVDAWKVLYPEDQ